MWSERQSGPPGTTGPEPDRVWKPRFQAQKDRRMEGASSRPTTPRTWQPRWVPGLAAREVAVGALGTVYALSATGNQVADQLTPMIAQTWPLATAFSLLAWYVFAPQCVATLAAVKRETNSWRYVLLMAGYLFGLAYLASFITYRVALALGA